MKTPTYLLTLVFFVLGLLTPTYAEDERFDPIAAQLVDRAVVMKLPDGVRRVRLRVKSEDGSWKVHTIAHLEGSEGFLKLRLPDGITEERLEVSASRTDPFPYSFYQGSSAHGATETDGSSAAGAPEQQAFAADRNGDAEGEQTVEESDIWKWRGSTLYFFNQYRGLQVIDVSDPAAPTRLASHRVESRGEKMYLHPSEDLVILLTQNANNGQGQVELVAHEATHVLQHRQTFPVPGYILESRLVGKILYVVSRNSWVERTTNSDGSIQAVSRSGLAITKIDLNDPDNPVASPALRLDGTNYSYWSAQVQATSSDALLISTRRYDSNLRQSFSTVHVIDISDPSRDPVVSHRLPIAGQVLKKFDMHLRSDILTVVSQVWRGTNRQRFASVETFDLSRSTPKLDQIEFANNESITASRVVGDLLYVVTFLRIDPLFVIDLRHPGKLRILSELEIPGFSTYLEPLDEETLLSIGVEGSQIAVSWFDVSDPTNTSLASRVTIGDKDGWSWSEANWDEKAFGFFPDDDLLLVPYSGHVPGEGWKSGVQLVELGDKELTARGNIPTDFPARRAKVIGDAVVAISGRSLRSLDVSDRDNPKPLAELVLAWPVDSVHRVGNRLVQLERGPGGFYHWGPTTTNATSYLHVSPADDTDELITSLVLPGGRLVGSFRKGDCLFTAHSNTVQVKGEEGQQYQHIFTTNVVDLGDPDRPIIVGSTSSTSEPNQYWGGSADYTGALLPDGTLVWHPTRVNHFIWFDVITLRGDALFPPFYGGGSSMVYTVDIRDKSAPAILAEAELNMRERGWSDGEPILHGSSLFYSMSESLSVTDEEGNRKWMSQHWMGELDLSNPAAPAAKELIEIPGTLRNIHSTSTGGTVLFTSTTRGYRAVDRSWKRELRVHALAYDGVQAFLIKEMVLDDWRYGPLVFDNQYLLIGSNVTEEVEGGNRYFTRFAVFAWNHGSGEFDETNSIDTAENVYDVQIHDGLIVARGSNLQFIDFADPANSDPASVEVSRPRYWYSALETINIHERSLAYLPQNFYGVTVVDFEGAFGPLPRGPLPSQEPTPEWEIIPFHMLTSTSSSGPLAGNLDEQLWSYAATLPRMDYTAWTRQSFGLDEEAVLPAPQDDSDGDGYSNLWEYFTGTNGNDASDFSSLTYFVHEDSGERFLAGYLALNPHAALTVSPEISFDLSEWTEGSDMVEISQEPFHPGIMVKMAKPLTAQRQTFLRASLTAAGE